MIIAVPLIKKSFESPESYKVAYTKATNWIAKNFVRSGELCDCQYSITQDKKYSTSYKIDVTVFVALNVSGEKGKFCKICKDFHKSFFINENYNCDRCNMITFVERINQQVKIKCAYKKEMYEK